MRRMIGAVCICLGFTLSSNSFAQTDQKLSEKERAEIECLTKIDVLNDLGGIEVLRNPSTNEVNINIKPTDVKDRGTEQAIKFSDEQAALAFYEERYFRNLTLFLSSLYKTSLLTVDELEAMVIACESTQAE